MARPERLSPGRGVHRSVGYACALLGRENRSCRTLEPARDERWRDMRASTLIFGVGTDLVEVVRIERVYAKFGEHFVKRLLTDEEQARFRQVKRQVRFLAMRFAAKEAVVKALGTGFAHGMWIRDVSVVADPRGRPCVNFSARGRSVCEALGVSQAHVSLSDEAGLVSAFAVAER